MSEDAFGEFALRLRALLEDGLVEASATRRRALLLDAAAADRRQRRLVGALATFFDSRAFERLNAQTAGRSRREAAVLAAAELHEAHGFDLPVSRDALNALLMALGETVEADFAPAPLESPQLVVDPMGRGDVTTLAAAVAASRAGGRIIMRPGLYREAVKITKPLEIIGEAGVVLKAPGKGVCIRLTGVAGRLENLVLAGSVAVLVDGGMAFLRGCDCSGDYGLRAGNGAFISLIASVVGDCRDACLSLDGGVLGIIEDNVIGEGEVFLSGQGTAPELRRNRIRGVVAIGEGAAPLVEDNDITGAGDYGVDVWAFDKVNDLRVTRPIIRRNRIIGCRLSGVFVHRGGEPIIEDNEIRENGDAGVEVSDPGSCPVIRGNRVNDNHLAGIWVRDGAAAVIDGNDLAGNTDGPLTAEPGTSVRS